MKIHSFLGLLLLASGCAALEGQIGCLATSQNFPALRGDTKTPHFVACNCPCSSKDRVNKGKLCLMCKHVHIPASKIIISGQSIPQDQRYKGTIVPSNPQEALKNFIVKLKLANQLQR